MYDFAQTGERAGLNYSGQNLASLENRRRKFSHSRTGSDFNPSGLAKGYRSSRGRKTRSKITINTHCKTIYTEVTPLVMASCWNLKAKIHILWRKTYWFDLIHIFRSKTSAHVPWPESLIYLFHFFFFRNELATLATLKDVLVAKVEVLAALATVLVAISSPTMCTFPFSHFCKTNKHTSLRSERPFCFFAATKGARSLTISSRKYDL